MILEENIEYIFDLWFDKKFLNKIAKAWPLQEKKTQTKLY